MLPTSNPQLSKISPVLAVAPILGTISEQEWDNLWLVFPKETQEQIKRNPGLKQSLTLKRYGLFTEDRVSAKRPIGFTVNPSKGGKWEMNCLTCHGGRIPTPEGSRFYLGAPATTTDYMTFIEDRIQLLLQFPKLSDVSWKDKLLMKQGAKALVANPVNRTAGTYNVWSSGDIYLALRKPNMKNKISAYLKAMMGHPVTLGNGNADMDPPAWWNTQYRDRLWIDGFAPKEPRMLSVIVMASDNDVVRLWNKGVFDDILTFVDSVEAPHYPLPINELAASRGKIAFERACTHCHGTYAEDGAAVDYPNLTIDLAKVGTDPARLTSGMTAEYRTFVRDSWVGNFGKADVRVAPKGYMAPPLRGIWATAPYLHNGSVPTLRQVLFPAERAPIWSIERSEFDWAQVGWRYQAPSAAQLDAVTIPSLRRAFFDTRLPGKSNAGHLFPERLTPDEREDALEYLKTL